MFQNIYTNWKHSFFELSKRHKNLTVILFTSSWILIQCHFNTEYQKKKQSQNILRFFINSQINKTQNMWEHVWIIVISLTCIDDNKITRLTSISCTMEFFVFNSVSIVNCTRRSCLFLKLTYYFIFDA